MLVFRASLGLLLICGILLIAGGLYLFVVRGNRGNLSPRLLSMGKVAISVMCLLASFLCGIFWAANNF